MSTGQADRIVKFQFGIEIDPEALTVVRQFQDQVDKTQRRMKESRVQAAREGTREEKQIEEEANRERLALRRTNIATETELRRLGLKEYRAAESEKEAAIRQTARAEEEAARSFERATDKQERAHIRMARYFTVGLHSVLQLARGIAEMGLSSEENTQKMLQGFMKIQAVFDTLTGGVRLWRSLAEQVRIYTKAVEAAANAELLMATAQGISAVAGGVAVGAGGARALGGSAHPVGAASPLFYDAAVGAGETALGVGLTAQAVRGGGFAAAGRFFGGLGRLAGHYALPAALAVTGGVAFAEGMAVLGGTESPIDAYMGMRRARAAAEESNKAVYEMQKRTQMDAMQREAAMRRATSGMATRRILAETDVEQQAWAGAAAAGLGGLRGRDLELALANQRVGFAGARTAQARTEFAGAMAMTPAGAGFNGEEVGEIRGRQEAARQEAIEAQKQEIDLVRERLRVEQQIGQEKIEKADQAIGKAQQELDLITKHQQTAVERFAMARPGQQTRAIGAMQRLLAGGRLSVRDIQQLQEVAPTEEVKELTGAQLRQYADEAGFGAVFGGQFEAKKRELQLTIQTQQDIKVQVEADVGRLVQQTMEAVAPMYERYRRDLEVAFNQKMEEQHKEDLRREMEFRTNYPAYKPK